MDDYFGWFDPAGWLNSIGNLISDGLGLLATPINNLAQGFNNFVSGVGNFFSNLINSLGTWFNDVFSAIGNLGASIGQWFTNLIGSIASLANSIGDWFAGVIDYLNPFSDNFFLKIAFVPSPGYFETFVTDIKTNFDGRFSFISDISDSISKIVGYSFGSTNEPPKFEITLPGGKYGTGKVSIIDFSIFEQYRAYIMTFIRVILWIPFLIKLYKRLPSLVYQ